MVERCVQAKEGYIPRLTSTDHCMQVKDDAGSPHLTLDDHCVYNKGDEGRHTLCMLIIC